MGMDMASMQPMIAMMMKDFKGSFRVEAPGDILRTNADRTEGRAAIWEMHGAQTDLVSRIQSLDFRVMFEGKNLQIADAQSR
jgi:hypothetical protein